MPVLSDVFTMNNVVRGLNAQVTFNQGRKPELLLMLENYQKGLTAKYVRQMRSSIVCLGSHLGTIAMPDFPLEAVRSRRRQLTSISQGLEAMRLVGCGYIEAARSSLGSTYTIWISHQ